MAIQRALTGRSERALKFQVLGEGDSGASVNRATRRISREYAPARARRPRSDDPVVFVVAHARVGDVGIDPSHRESVHHPLCVALRRADDIPDALRRRGNSDFGGDLGPLRHRAQPTCARPASRLRWRHTSAATLLALTRARSRDRRRHAPRSSRGCLSIIHDIVHHRVEAAEQKQRELLASLCLRQRVVVCRYSPRIRSRTASGWDRNGWWPASSSATLPALRANSRCSSAGVPRSSAHTR